MYSLQKTLVAKVTFHSSLVNNNGISAYDNTRQESTKHESSEGLV